MTNRDVIVISKSAIRNLLIFLLAMALVGVAAFATWQYREERKRNEQAQADIARLSNPSESAKAAEENIIASIRTLAIVPEDETPTILNVADAEQLKGQLFFDDLQNDDKIISFPKARKFITYRPSTNQVITVVTIPEGDELPQTSQESEEEQ